VIDENLEENLFDRIPQILCSGRSVPATPVSFLHASRCKRLYHFYLNSKDIYIFDAFFPLYLISCRVFRTSSGVTLRYRSRLKKRLIAAITRQKVVYHLLRPKTYICSRLKARTSDLLGACKGHISAPL
jgi:hypothetical protein